MNLVEGIQEECRRVREELIPEYESIGTAGRPALQLVLRPAVSEGEAAIASGDPIRMIAALKALKECE